MPDLDLIHHPWKGHVPPFRIFGNMYFIGTVPASTHLIDTGDGLILIDPGFPNALYLVLENMRALGFAPEAVRKIICTHGHYDHMGAAKALRELTGAEIAIGAADADICRGVKDLSWAKELGYSFDEAFEPDVLLREGDTIALGDTEILCRTAPGHTPGTMAFFWNVTDGTSTLRAGMHGGVGMNSMSASYLAQNGLDESWRAPFVPAIERLLDEHVDIHVGNHVKDNDTLCKAKAVSGGHNPFIDPAEWRNFLRETANKYQAMIRAENSSSGCGE